MTYCVIDKDLERLEKKVRIHTIVHSAKLKGCIKQADNLYLQYITFDEIGFMPFDVIRSLYSKSFMAEFIYDVFFQRSEKHHKKIDKDVLKVCNFCGKQFLVMKKYSRQLYCSTSCKKKQYRKKQKECSE